MPFEAQLQIHPISTRSQLFEEHAQLVLEEVKNETVLVLIFTQMLSPTFQRSEFEFAFYEFQNLPAWYHEMKSVISKFFVQIRKCVNEFRLLKPQLVSARNVVLKDTRNFQVFDYYAKSKAILSKVSEVCTDLLTTHPSHQESHRAIEMRDL